MLLSFPGRVPAASAPAASALAQSSCLVLQMPSPGCLSGTTYAFTLNTLKTLPAFTWMSLKYTLMPRAVRWSRSSASIATTT